MKDTKNRKNIFSILSTDTKKHLKEKLSKHCFTGKRLCTYSLIRQRGGIMLSAGYGK